MIENRGSEKPKVGCLHLTLTPEDVLVIYNKDDNGLPIADPKKVSIIIPDGRTRHQKYGILIDSQNDFSYSRYKALQKQAAENKDYIELKRVVDEKIKGVRMIQEGRLEWRL